MLKHEIVKKKLENKNVLELADRLNQGRPLSMPELQEVVEYGIHLEQNRGPVDSSFGAVIQTTLREHFNRPDVASSRFDPEITKTLLRQAMDPNVSENIGENIVFFGALSEPDVKELSDMALHSRKPRLSEYIVRQTPFHG